MDDVTRAFEPCGECPPLVTWPELNLILGSCPRCTRMYEDQTKLSRALRAKKVLAQRDNSAQGEKP